MTLHHNCTKHNNFGFSKFGKDWTPIIKCLDCGAEYVKLKEPQISDSKNKLCKHVNYVRQIDAVHFECECGKVFEDHSVQQGDKK